MKTPLDGGSQKRLAAIISLLEIAVEGLPTPTRRAEASSGFVHKTRVRVDCEDCLANGRALFGCETCGGRGYTEQWRHRDPYATDKVMPYGLAPDRHERTRERDAQIDRLAEQTAPPKSEKDLLAETRPERWELDRRRLYAIYDLAALDLWLDALRVVDDGAYHALHSVYVYRLVEPSAGYEAACQRGLRFLEARLPDPLRAPDSAIKEKAA